MTMRSTLGLPALGALLLLGTGCGDDSPRRSPSADTAVTASSAASAGAAATVQPTPGRRVVVAGVDLGAIGYDKGSPAAPLVVVEFSDFGCQYCGAFARGTFPALDREFIRTGKVYFKYVPFVMGMFPNASEATRAAECAGEQNLFWPMYDRLFAAQSEWKGARAPDEVFARYATGAGLDKSRFAECYGRAEKHPRTSRANDAADRLGVRVTPSFLVNGQPVEGALPLADFRRLLSELAKVMKPSP